MKDLLIGLAVGMIAGAILTESNHDARQLIKKGKKAISKKIEDMTEKI